jgi:hypothetical protein
MVFIARQPLRKFRIFSTRLTDRTQVHLQQIEKNGKLPDAAEYKQELKASAESLPALVKQTRKEIFQKCKEAAEGSSKAASANEVSEMARLLTESTSPHSIKGLQVFQHQGMQNPMYLVPHEFMRTHLMPSVLMQARRSVLGKGGLSTTTADRELAVARGVSWERM